LDRFGRPIKEEVQAEREAEVTSKKKSVERPKTQPESQKRPPVAKKESSQIGLAEVCSSTLEPETKKKKKKESESKPREGPPKNRFEELQDEILANRVMMLEQMTEFHKNVELCHQECVETHAK